MMIATCDRCKKTPVYTYLCLVERIGEEGPQSGGERRCRECIVGNPGRDIIEWWAHEEENRGLTDEADIG